MQEWTSQSTASGEVCIVFVTSDNNLQQTTVMNDLTCSSQIRKDVSLIGEIALSLTRSQCDPGLLIFLASSTI